MPERSAIAIIGPGRVGGALAIALTRANWPVAAMGGRSADHARTAMEALADQHEPLQQVPCLPAAKAASAGEIVLLTVGDARIGPLCDELARAGALAHRPVVAHGAGALGSDVLGAAAEVGCPVASMHPLQTFADATRGADRLAGTRLFCEGDPTALAAIRPIAEAIGAVFAEIPSAAKPLYHAAAVMACNHLAALLDAAMVMGTAAGVDGEELWAGLAPLVQATLDNVSQVGPAQALTGPVARGEADTLARNLRALGDLPERLRAFFHAAAGWTVDLADRAGRLDEVSKQRLTDVLDEYRRSTPWRQ